MALRFGDVIVVRFPLTDQTVGVQDTDVRENSRRAQLVYRRLADAEPARDVGHEE